MDSNTPSSLPAYGGFMNLGGTLSSIWRDSVATFQHTSISCVRHTKKIGHQGVQVSGSLARISQPTMLPTNLEVTARTRMM